MAIFRKGDMWSVMDKVDIFCFTANTTIKKDGSLVMGRGMALQVKRRFPGIDFSVGKIIANQPARQHYGFIVVPWPGADIGVFQVKHHFKNKADISLIKGACVSLFEYLLDEPSTVALNFPGIGNGGLSKDLVMPILTFLPDCVEIWEYA